MVIRIPVISHHQEFADERKEVIRYMEVPPPGCVSDTLKNATALKGDPVIHGGPSEGGRCSNQNQGRMFALLRNNSLGSGVACVESVSHLFGLKERGDNFSAQ